jgi:hypothetical protein
VCGFAIVVGSVLGGLMYDLTDSFVAVFLYVGGAYFASFLYDEVMYRDHSWFVSPCCAETKRGVKYEPL